MLLTIDIGNSTTKVGLYQTGKLRHCEEILTASSKRESARCLVSLIGRPKTAPGDTWAVALAGVVPAKQRMWEALCREYLEMGPFTIDGATPGPLKNLYRPRQSLGADRLAAATAAAAGGGTPAISVMLGTATVVDAVSGEREFMGGAILPGLALQASSLASGTAQLPEIAALKAARAIGRGTPAAIGSGIILGTAGAIERLVREFRGQLGKEAKVVITGGYARQVMRNFSFKADYKAHLVLEGIRLIWKFNTGGKE